MRVFAAATALALLAATAAAQTTREPTPSIVGQWAFETGPFGASPDGRGGCRISGTMSITRSPRGDYACSFIARERCKSGLSVDAEQSCTAKRSGAGLEITSTILRTTPGDIGYAPDNWTLTIQSRDLMTGALRSADTARATFRRGPAMIS